MQKIDKVGMDKRFVKFSWVEYHNIHQLQARTCALEYLGDTKQIPFSLVFESFCFVLLCFGVFGFTLWWFWVYLKKRDTNHKVGCVQRWGEPRRYWERKNKPWTNYIVWKIKCFVEKEYFLWLILLKLFITINMY